MEDNKKINLSDEALDEVAGGANLEAWWASGRQGAPICTFHPTGNVVMDSYYKDGQLYVECPYCKKPKLIG